VGDKQYNGFTNRETYLAATRIGNIGRLYTETRTAVRSALGSPAAGSRDNRMRLAAVDTHSLVYADLERGGAVSEFAAAALDRVNWAEIAEGIAKTL
jgi:hypothetical protein